MALVKKTLEDDILDGFNAGLDGASRREAAQYLAFAILAYASEAEVICAPGPILIPGAPPVPSSATGRKVKVATADVGKMALWDSISANFDAELADMSIAAAGIVAYVASSFTVFSGGGITVTGAAVMPPPLINLLSTVPQVGLDTGDSQKVAEKMATVIDSAFKGTMFTGVCTAPDGGVGPVVGTLI